MTHEDGGEDGWVEISEFVEKKADEVAENVGVKEANAIRRHAAKITDIVSDYVEQRVRTDKGGVRGRKEIEEKLEEVEEKIGTTLVGFHLQDKKEALQWVLGEVDDL